MTLVIGCAALGAWIYLLLGRGMFWLGRERDGKDPPPEPAAWPAVVAVVPARDEADVVGRALASLHNQDYPGPFRILLVDDNSTDGTAEVALETRGRPLETLSGSPPPQGWTGKLWAQSQGVARACEGDDPPAYILFSDADISHERANLRRLVARAEAGSVALTSLMARLTVRTGSERLLIPAFIFFFQMLFPFAWVNDPGRRTAAAAGGCMLVRREALEAAGGLAAIRGNIIDDCALARLLKQHGPIWLGLTKRVQSLRPYSSFGEIARMVARSAYAQLDHSPVLLAGTVLGMLIVYAAAPLLAVFAEGPARWLGLAAWIAMAIAIQPTLRLYRLWFVWGAALPLAGGLYGAFTVWSAVRSWQGKGGQWKGRVQDSLLPHGGAS